AGRRNIRHRTPCVSGAVCRAPSVRVPNQARVRRRHMHAEGAVGGRRGLVLAAMIFAVAMTFIDQTIVSIAAPKIQDELGLTNTDIQWAIISCLLALAAFFAFGGGLADMVGLRPMVVIGVAVFAGASVLCGFTPTGSYAEAWLVTFRAVQGLGGALMYPAAL